MLAGGSKAARRSGAAGPSDTAGVTPGSPAEARPGPADLLVSSIADTPGAGDPATVPAVEPGAS